MGKRISTFSMMSTSKIERTFKAILLSLLLPYRSYPNKSIWLLPYLFCENFLNLTVFFQGKMIFQTNLSRLLYLIASDLFFRFNPLILFHFLTWNFVTFKRSRSFWISEIAMLHLFLCLLMDFVEQKILNQDFHSPVFLIRKFLTIVYKNVVLKRKKNGTGSTTCWRRAAQR